MFSMSSRKVRTAVVGAVALVAGSAGTLAFAGSAEAIPATQKHCAFDARRILSTSGWQPVNSAVVVRNGSVARHVVVNFNADAGVTPNAEIRLGYRVDGGPIQTPGAQNFANYTQYWQTRHSMVVLAVPKGNHVIRPYWRISGGAGTSGVIAARCLTAESYTS